RAVVEIDVFPLSAFRLRVNTFRTIDRKGITADNLMLRARPHPSSRWKVVIQAMLPRSARSINIHDVVVSDLRSVKPPLFVQLQSLRVWRAPSRPRRGVLTHVLRDSCAIGKVAIESFLQIDRRSDNGKDAKRSRPSR